MKLLKKLILGLGAALFVLALVLGGYRIVSGRSLGLKSLAYNSLAWAINPIKMVTNGAEIAQQNQGDYSNIVFLHHSTGNNLIEQSDLRELLQQDGYQFWDHHYNEGGLRGPDGSYAGYNYSIPADNTDPDGLARIFSQPVLPLPLNSFSALMQHEVIVYKSCFRPANNITSDGQLEQYKAYYSGIKATMAAHPEKMFVIMTIPPLNPAETDAKEAARARVFSQWMQSEEFLSGLSNVYVFDFYALLAENDPSAPDYNMLRADYRVGMNSHPNQDANETIGPILADFLKDSIEKFRSGRLSKVD